MKPAVSEGVNDWYTVMMRAIVAGVIAVCLLIGAWSVWGINRGATPVDVGESSVDEVAAEPLVDTIEVYDGIYVRSDERILDLSGYGLTGSLKAEVRRLTQLEVLDLSNNSFTAVPAEVGQLSRLQILNLSENPLTGLPHELGNLQNLQELDLRGTNASEADMTVIEERLPGTAVIFRSE